MNPLESSSFINEASSGSSAGQMLRVAREAKGIHLAVLSVALKVPTRKLEALERDDHGAFEDVIFLRALAQSVCRHLGIEAAPVLAALPNAPRNLELPKYLSDGRMVPALQDSRRAARSILPSRLVSLLVMFMIAAAAALIWWPSSPPQVVASSSIDDASSAYVPMGQASNPVIELSSVSAAPGVEGAAAIPHAVNLTPPTQTPAATPSPGTTFTSESGLLVHAKLDTWVEVRDAKGELLVKRQVKAGGTLRQYAQAPLFLYVGRADSTEVVWKGQTQDLKPHTQNNEARLKIYP